MASVRSVGDPDNPFVRLLDRFPSGNAAAQAAQVGANTVSQWRSRGRIPEVHWLRLAEGARAQRVAGVTYRALSQAAEALRMKERASSNPPPRMRRPAASA